MEELDEVPHLFVHEETKLKNLKVYHICFLNKIANHSVDQGVP